MKNVINQATPHDAELDSKQIFEAFYIWYRNYEHKELDNQIKPFLNLAVPIQSEGWLRKVRQALYLSSGEVAKRINMSRGGYTNMEWNVMKKVATLP
ncbi:MAG: helix-turn-helix transcriptional regulator [Oligoflexia bacterium]|nr:helix-turn-helix transcriptional regulator [Oligoflexia bacterium]